MGSTPSNRSFVSKRWILLSKSTYLIWFASSDLEIVKLLVSIEAVKDSISFFNRLIFSRRSSIDSLFCKNAKFEELKRNVNKKLFRNFKLIKRDFYSSILSPSIFI